jgi:hypothetical protein
VRCKGSRWSGRARVRPLYRPKTRGRKEGRDWIEDLGGGIFGREASVGLRWNTMTPSLTREPGVAVTHGVGSRRQPDEGKVLRSVAGPAQKQGWGRLRGG